MPAGKQESTLTILKCLKTEKQCNLLQCICCGRGIAHRLIMALVITFGIIICFTQRVCLNLAITEMTVPKNTTDKKPKGEACTIPGGKGRPTIDPIEGGKFPWDEGTQSYILMAFYVGYLFCNIPAGYLCDRFGAKPVILIGVSISSIATGLIPLATIYTHWGCIVALRAMAGLGQAPIYPGATQLMARWVPENERSAIGGLVLASLSLGTILGNIPSAYIMETFETWVWVFYTYAIGGGVFVVIFFLFVFSTPASDKHITQEENNYLNERLVLPLKGHKVPIKAILRDLVVWVCIINQFGNDYTLYTIITNFPKYLNDVLKFTSKEGGLLVCIPQLAMFLGSFIFGAITDALIFRAGFHVVTLRVWNTAFATIVPCACLMICIFLRCHRIGAIASITLGMFIKAMFYGGMKVTIIDITKHHTGLVAAIVNSAGGVAGAIAPYTIGQIAVDNTFEQWDQIGYISLTIAVASALPYMLFCKAERRKWDYGDDEEPPLEDLEITGRKNCFSCVNPH